MTPLLLFLLGGAATYLGTVTAAFSALMELSLRIMAEGSGRDERLKPYLDDPRRLFIPGRLLLGTIPVLAAALLARVTGVDQAGFPLLIVSVVAFVLLCEHVIPLIIVRRDPERVLDVLLPSFDAVARLLSPLTHALLRMGTSTRRRQGQPVDGATSEADGEEPPANGNGNGDVEPLEEGQAREMLRTLVDFRETMVREVMTPRPDIVAVNATATIEQLQNLFREQQYSRMPAYQDTLENVVGFVFVKDLIHQAATADIRAPITPLVRPANFVPETKRVVELLREFQQNRLQMAIVVDEYGGTAGLVTLEDLLEEIVGEIRDEYDVEVEPVVDEGGGRFVFSGKAHVQELTEHLRFTPEGEGFETVGGYLLSRLGRVPVTGERFEIDGLAVEVLEAERRRITRVRMFPAVESSAAMSGPQ
jgi:putative hemolysin